MNGLIWCAKEEVVDMIRICKDAVNGIRHIQMDYFGGWVSHADRMQDGHVSTQLALMSESSC